LKEEYVLVVKKGVLCKKCLGGMGDFLLERLFALAIGTSSGTFPIMLSSNVKASPGFGVAGVGNASY
jgi:hypothetical protein